jgi:hypothetical protein
MGTTAPVEICDFLPLIGAIRAKVVRPAPRLVRHRTQASSRRGARAAEVMP